jgi:chromosome segregation ATPase
MRASYLSIQRFDEAVGRLRADITTAVDQMDTRRTALDQDTKKLRDLDREAMNKALEEARNDVFARLDRELQARRAEEERLSRIAVELQTYADNLSKGFDEFQRTLTFLEEQRRLDSRRISDTNSEIADMSKRLEGHQAKLELIEELARRNERGVEEVARTLTEYKQQRQDWLQEEARATQERERAMADMVKRMDGFAKEMETFAKQFETFTETHRTMKKYVDDFDRLAERMDRRLNEVAEIQRLSEDRFRQEWEEFLQEDQKRWRQFTLTNEEAWRTNEKIVTEVRGDLAELKEHREAITAQVKVMVAAQHEAVQVIANAMQTMREQIGSGGK